MKNPATEFAKQNNLLKKMHLEFLYGGTFDPIHLGHIAVIQALRELAPKVPVRLLPCAIPALKSIPGGRFEQRVEMLRLGCKEIPEVTIDTREQLRNEKSYTIDTLQELSEEMPQKCWVWVMGVDSLQELHRWYKWQQLKDFCHLLVINRPGYTDELYLQQSRAAGFEPASRFIELGESLSGKSFWLKMPEKTQSSSKIRRMSINDDSFDTMLPQSVIEYIRQHRLYESEKS